MQIYDRIVSESSAALSFFPSWTRSLQLTWKVTDWLIRGYGLASFGEVYRWIVQCRGRRWYNSLDSNCHWYKGEAGSIEWDYSIQYDGFKLRRKKKKAMTPSSTIHPGLHTFLLNIYLFASCSREITPPHQFILRGWPLPGSPSIQQFVRVGWCTVVYSPARYDYMHYKLADIIIDRYSPDSRS